MIALISYLQVILVPYQSLFVGSLFFYQMVYFYAIIKNKLCNQNFIVKMRYGLLFKLHANYMSSVKVKWEEDSTHALEQELA